ncbi:hypothetical protein K7432_009203, partial [Basidiobolus ranarum]
EAEARYQNEMALLCRQLEIARATKTAWAFPNLHELLTGFDCNTFELEADWKSLELSVKETLTNVSKT